MNAPRIVSAVLAPGLKPARFDPAVTSLVELALRGKAAAKIDAAAHQALAVEG